MFLKLSRVHVDNDVLEYIVDIVRATREHPAVLLGASPRAAVHLLYASKAYAVISEGRDYVVPDDVKSLAFDILNHRIMLRPEYLVESYSRESTWRYDVLRKVVNDVLGRVKAPK